MASRYDENTKARAVRLVREHADDYETEWAAMKATSSSTHCATTTCAPCTAHRTRREHMVHGRRGSCTS
jgi:hypothetical protein